MTEAHSSAISPAQDALYRKLNEDRMWADDQITRCTNTLDKTPNEHTRRIVDTQRLDHLRTRTDALVGQAYLRNSLSPENIQSCFVTPLSQQGDFQTIGSLVESIKGYEKATKKLCDEADGLSNITDASFKERKRSKLLNKYRTLVSLKTEAKAAKRDTWCHYAEEHNQDYTDIRKMPQTDLIEDMERNRRQMWEDKFIARMDGNQATRQRLTEELADQLTSLIGVQAERRQFLIDLRNGNLSSWAHTIADGDTTPFVPPDRHRTSTNQPTNSLGTGTSVTATSFPGSVQSSAPQSSYASAADRSARCDHNPDLAPLDRRVHTRVEDQGFSQLEKRDRVLTELEDDTMEICRSMTSNLRESEAFWKQNVEPHLQSLQHRVGSAVTDPGFTHEQMTKRVMSDYKSWNPLANRTATTSRCELDDHWRHEMGAPSSILA